MQKVLGLALAFAWGAQAQQVNVRGKVIDGSGKAVANAIAEIAKLKSKDTTAADGSFAITGTVSALRGGPRARSEAIAFDNGFLTLPLGDPARAVIEIFDAKGDLAHRETYRERPAGSYRLDLRANLPSNG